MLILTFSFPVIGMILNEILNLISFRAILDNLLNLFRLWTNHFIFKMVLYEFIELEFLPGESITFGFRLFGSVM